MKDHFIWVLGSVIVTLIYLLFLFWCEDDQHASRTYEEEIKQHKRKKSTKDDN